MFSAIHQSSLSLLVILTTSPGLRLNSSSCRAAYACVARYFSSTKDLLSLTFCIGSPLVHYLSCSHVNKKKREGTLGNNRATLTETPNRQWRRTWLHQGKRPLHRHYLHACPAWCISLDIQISLWMNTLSPESHLWWAQCICLCNTKWR